MRAAKGQRSATRIRATDVGFALRRSPFVAWAVVAAKLKELAPYAMIELLLPGGSMLALTLWFYRRRRKKALELANI